ncbi:MAG: hypothetical protein FJ288_13780 [Planctomycetes bacterium]|nr:hypothetical protein [Planctomycetota bacterium]
MGLIFGAYAAREAAGALRRRWDRGVTWLRSTYPRLTVAEHHCGPLLLGSAVTSPLEIHQGRGNGWQMVLVGTLPYRSLSGPEFAGVRDVRDAVWKLAGTEGRFASVVRDEDAAAAFLVTDWACWYLVFWTKCADGVVFSSHPGLLLRLVEPRPRVDPVGAANLLMMGYQLDNKTLFEGVTVFRPGEMLVLHNGTIENREFSLPFSTNGFGATPKLLEGRFHEALVDSVRGRIEGYRRVVVPLSSGMDSRFIGASLRELGANVETVTHDWRGRIDWVISKRVAKRLGSRHRRIRIPPHDMAEGMVRAGHMLCLEGAHEETFQGKLSPYDPATVLLAGNVGDAMEGVNLPAIDGTEDELHEHLYKGRRQALWSDAEVEEIGRELGLALPRDSVYDLSRSVFRAHTGPLLPFQRCMWWDYMGFQRRYVSYQSRVCDVHVPVGMPYVDGRLWTELLSWPRYMLTHRRGVNGAMERFYPDLATIPRAKAGGRSRITPTLAGMAADAVTWRIPGALQPMMPVCIGGGRSAGSVRTWRRLLDALIGRASWMSGRWHDRFRRNVSSPMRFLALACLLQQVEVGQS